MGRIAVDFGTGNTVVARFNETTQQTETLHIPKITTEFRYRLEPEQPEQLVHVVPSMIHYSETETLIGDQVLSRGLAEHKDTVRWMKRGIAQGVTKHKKTDQGHKNPAQAGEDFLRRLLTGISDQISLATDEFTFTAPTDAFERFEDWLRQVCEALGIQRVRLLDEPTACVLGYQGAARKDERFVVFDFGCGTLDVAAVRIDLGAAGGNKTVQLGRAGCDLGGLDIDYWMTEDFCQQHQLSEYERRELRALILRQAEATKIALSNSDRTDEEMQVINRMNGGSKLMQTTYRRSCKVCAPRQEGAVVGAGETCLGCLLEKHEFLKRTRRTLEQALENAAVKAAMRRDDVTKLLVTGGTSLLPCVRRLLVEWFGERAIYCRPFDAVAHGACPERDLQCILQHDYCLWNYNPQRGEHEFVALLKLGTEYPTERDFVRKSINGTANGQTRCGLLIYEVSQLRRHQAPMRIGLDGEILPDDDKHSVRSEFVHVCLNKDNPKFIVADPPINVARDKNRFLSSFWVNGHRQLLVTVRDNLTGKIVLEDDPVVRL